MMSIGRALMTGLVLCAAPGSAQEPFAEASTAFTEGRFLEAAELAEAAGGSAGIALAAEKERNELVERAIEAGEAAVLEYAFGLPSRNRHEESIHEAIEAALEERTCRRDR